ncbi:glycosyl hydrolase 108 family protein [uncultured Kiloniella sp.]|uniref:glycoside hydrolase family 108 protein n=1 Tax=uncultured Kiloniella sp. TaxID=1133091 RepID=UPI0026124F6D|nr:glycosyl hydrolase 108 family protein [uncultured Kiloniella sp.]
MPDLKTKTINNIIDREGEAYTNDPDDSGRKTKWGITEAVARHYGYKGPMWKMPRAKAFEIYESLVWTHLKLDQISIIHFPLAEEVADTATNMGGSAAAKFLQASLNALNNRQKLYPDIKVDGGIGNQTLNALKAFLSHRGNEGGKVITRACNCLQGAKYISLSQSREKDEKYVYGWLLNRCN